MSSPPPSCPYLGIRPFARKDAELFFGRNDTVNDLIDLLGQNRFVTVIAPSGYGKSSLVKAGLIPNLDAGMMGGHSDWSIIECHPGDDPFNNLTEQLLEDDTFKRRYAPDSSRKMAIPSLKRELEQSSHSLKDIVARTLTPIKYKLFILVDQFEEIFRFHQRGDSAQSEANEQQQRKTAEHFVQLLLNSFEHPDIYIVLTMRLEYLAECPRFDELPEAINQGFFLVPRLTPQQLSEIIKEPAKKFNGSVVTSLHDKLLEEMAFHPERLPLLQHVLKRMWTVEQVNPVQLTLNSFNRSGEMRALSIHADDIYDALPDEPYKKIAEILFKQLTEKRCDDQYLRRPCRLADMKLLKKYSEGEINEVIQKFSGEENYLLRVDGDQPIDITHESLISQWERLRQWADEEAEMADIYKELEKKAQASKKQEKWDNKEKILLQEEDLKKALLWRNKEPTSDWAERYGGDFHTAMQFLARSEDEFNKVTQQQGKEKQRLLELDREKQQALQSNSSELEKSGEFACCRRWFERWLRQQFSFSFGRSKSNKKDKGLKQKIQ